MLDDSPDICIAHRGSRELDKCRCRLVPQTNAVLGSYALTMNGMTSTLAHNFAKNTTVLTATKKLPGGQVQSSGLQARCSILSRVCSAACTECVWQGSCLIAQNNQSYTCIPRNASS